MQATLVWLVLLGLLAVAIILTLRRMSALASRTRELERFQAGVRTAATGLRTVSEPLVRDLDALRRGAADGASVAGAVNAARLELGRIAGEAGALPSPAALAPLAGALQAELDRAVRAVDLVQHGLGVLADTRGGRDTEAQTSLKRGTLNLRHAAEVCDRLAAQAEAIRPADLGDPARLAAAAASPRGTYQVDADIEP